MRADDGVGMPHCNGRERMHGSRCHREHRKREYDPDSAHAISLFSPGPPPDRRGQIGVIVLSPSMATDNCTHVGVSPIGWTTRSPGGSRCTSYAFGSCGRKVGVHPSMGSVGDAYHFAMCESLFASLECKLVDRHAVRTQGEARRAVFRFIERVGLSAPAPLEPRLRVAGQLRGTQPKRGGVTLGPKLMPLRLRRSVRSQLPEADRERENHRYQLSAKSGLTRPSPRG